MQYMISFQETAEEFARRTSADAPVYWAAWGAYVQALNQSGIVRGGAGLQPPATATTIRSRHGELHVQDGPFSETKEMLAGFFLIEVESLDQAMEWAKKAPCLTTGSIEIRPVLPPMNR
ncbi:MAG: YciI family protein [Candidatus Sumerlaeia bacterium]|nr:YciI family protein [Candidatus Sumerlaeia bacterium]